MVCATDCFLFARMQLKQEGAFASNSKYVVCLNNFSLEKVFVRFPAFANSSCCVIFELKKFVYVG